MADRYWVGGTAAWDGTAGTKWATTSGGPGGASRPTSVDDVFFDAASTGTCTISSGNAGAKSINCTGFTGTLAGSSIDAITVSGSVTFVAGMTLTYSGLLTLNGTGTLTSGGKTLGPVTINGSGITVTLGDALTSSGAITVTRGTFTTNNNNVTATSLSSSTVNTRTINLGSSTVTLSGTNPVDFTNGNATLTFNAGTSLIAISGTATTLRGGASGGSTGVSFYNVSFTSTTVTTQAVQAINTFNNLTVTGPASAGVMQFVFDSRQTINGTLSTTGTAGNCRVWFRGVTYGIAQTLTINSAPSLTDADFRDIYVKGTAAPISGTRIGDLQGCRGITFDTPKTVYWNLAGVQNWSANGWSDTSTGTPNTNFFPLAQDTARFTNAGSVTGTITLDTAIPYIGSIDMSGRTNAMTLNVGSGIGVIYGDWKNGSGTTLAANGTLTFSSRNTQTITSAGKTFSGSITINSYGGTVELADALNLGTNTLTVTNGTFDTKNFTVTLFSLSSDNSNVRTINLGSSIVNIATGGISFNTSSNLTFNAGTSNIVLPQDPNMSINCGSPQVFYNITANANASSISNRDLNFTNVSTIANLTLRAPSVNGTCVINFTGDVTITGTLQVVNTSIRRRYAIRRSTPHVVDVKCNLSVGTLIADNCDFESINLTGAAINAVPTNAGDCGNNAGIIFPSPKTLYWNLSGTQDFFSNGWSLSSGGSPDINNFPLAQDAAVFDNAGAAGTVSIPVVFRLGSLEMGSRTTAMTLTISSTLNIFKNLRFGSGVTFGQDSFGSINIASYEATNYFKNNGVTIPYQVTINSVRANIELEDAFITTKQFRILYGKFNAKTYDVTAGAFLASGTSVVLKMGSGTWTLTYSSEETFVWSISSITFYKDTANIVLSSTSVNSRTFSGGSFSYNKLTIGGATGTSTTTITGNNQFTELASTKTVAHTIALGSTIQIFGKWTVTGTAGNVVTLTGTGTSHQIVGACTSGIDYLAMGSIGFSPASPGEFYAGANSTGTAGAPVYRTAKPADSTRYWVGGTGNWSNTARWSTESGGLSGASVPRSHDDVVFDSASNATAYTATVNVVTGGIRMKSLTIAGPASGNVTLAGSTAIDGIHGNVTLPATGLTRTYTGAITLSGSTTGKTISTNNVTLASAITINGVGCEWTLGSALDIGATNNLNIYAGSFITNNYPVSTQSLNAIVSNGWSMDREIRLGSSTVTTSTSATFPVMFGVTSPAEAETIVFDCGTSTILINASGTFSFSGNGKTFYNVSFTSTSAGSVTINGANSFNNLSFTGLTSAGLKIISLSTNQTVTGTLTFSAGTNATMRHFVRSNTNATTRTLTVAAFSGTDVDFRDITMTGAAAPVSGTRLGDCKGNSGITFVAGKTVWWRGGTGDWGANNWSATNGGSIDATQFPLAQDTATIPSGFPASGNTITINAAYNIGTIDMSARTTNTVTLACSQLPVIYGNWINGTGTTLTGGGQIIFSGRGTQTITSAGKTFTSPIGIDSPGGTVTLQDTYISSSTSGGAINVIAGVFDANGYDITLNGGGVSTTSSSNKTIAIGSGTWTLTRDSNPWTIAAAGLTVTGTGTISLTSANNKTFAGGNVAYTNIRLNQGGNGALTITGNNTFKTISSTAAGANTINIGTTTQQITTSWTAAGTAGNILTVQGASATSPGALVFTGSGTAANVNYLTITGVRAYNLNTTWYAGANSTNFGSLGWEFETYTAPSPSNGNFFLLY
jgi:hypothetical protein